MSSDSMNIPVPVLPKMFLSLSHIQAFMLIDADGCSGMATSEEDAEFEEDDELAADPLGENSDEFAANNQLHNELGHSEDEEASEEGEEEGEGHSDEDAEGESDEEMAENNGGEESEEEEDEEEDGEG